jgi:hypothetical protein
VHSFKTTDGVAWDIEGNMGSWARVKSQCNVDLTDIATDDRKSLEQLADAFQLTQVLWAIVEPQALQRHVTVDDFLGRMNGDTLVAAHMALLEEMVFFCPSRARTVLSLMVDKLRAAEAAADKTLPTHLPEIERTMDEAIASLTCGTMPASSQESSESTPGAGAFGSSMLPSKAASGRVGTTPARSSRRSRKSTATRSNGRHRTPGRRFTR